MHWRKFSLCSGSGKSPLRCSLTHALLQFGTNEDLPATAVPSEVHQAFAAVDLDARGTLRPVGNLSVAWRMRGEILSM